MQEVCWIVNKSQLLSISRLAYILGTCKQLHQELFIVILSKL